MMMSDEMALFANEAFYAAFREGDHSAMAALWADDAKLCCLHPNWEPLFGRPNVLASWREILRHPPPVTCVNPYVISTQFMATVFCYEQIEGTVLAATNVFVLEEGRPRICHHQAAGTRGKPSAEENARPTIN